MAAAEEGVIEAQKGRETSDEREKLLADLKTEEEERDQQETRLKDFADNDPAVLEAMAAESSQAIEAANRWTDNIFSIQSWIKKKFPSVEQVRK